MKLGALEGRWGPAPCGRNSQFADDASVHAQEPKQRRRKTVLVPLDFNESAKPALEYALCMALRVEALIVLLHVVECSLCPVMLVPWRARPLAARPDVKGLCGNKFREFFAQTLGILRLRIRTHRVLARCEPQVVSFQPPKGDLSGGSSPENGASSRI